MNCTVIVPAWATLLLSILTGLSYSETIVLLMLQYALYNKMKAQQSSPPQLCIQSISKWLSQITSIVANRIFTTDLGKIFVTCGLLVLMRMLLAVVSVKVAIWLVLSWWMVIPLLEMKGINIKKNQEEGYKFFSEVWTAFQKDISYKNE